MSHSVVRSTKKILWNFFHKIDIFFVFSYNETFMRVIFFQTMFTECMFNAVFTESNVE